MTGSEPRNTVAMTKAEMTTIAIAIVTMLGGVLAALVPSAGAADIPPGQKLFQTNNCVTCHTIDHKLVGPSFMDVAKKYAGQPDAVPTLSDAIKKGHVGTWGPVPMPPHPTLSDADIKTLVDWILSLK